jgi:hypothetical protein
MKPRKLNMRGEKKDTIVVTFLFFYYLPLALFGLLKPNYERPVTIITDLSPDSTIKCILDKPLYKVLDNFIDNSLIIAYII